MLVSIVILNWKGKYEDCLEAVQSAINQSYTSKEIIFVDNGSEDRTLELIKSVYPGLKYIELAENLGVTGGRNKGAEACSGELIFFLENDGAWVSNNVVEDVVTIFQRHKNLGVLYTAVEGYHTGKKDPTVDPYIQTNKGTLVSSSFRGGAAIIRTSLFNLIGGFPDEYFRQTEEKYFSIFAYDLGFIIAYEPALVMRHKGSDYKGKGNIVSWYGCINDLKTIIRHYPSQSKHLVILFKYITWVFRFLIQNKFKNIVELHKVLFIELKHNSKYKKVSNSTIYFIERMNAGYYGDILLDDFDDNLLKNSSRDSFFKAKITAKIKSIIKNN